MSIEEIKELAGAFGWIDLGPQKNSFMLSFRHEETGARMNVYHTTMTVTFQDGDRAIQSFRDVDVGVFESIIQVHT